MVLTRFALKMILLAPLLWLILIAAIRGLAVPHIVANAGKIAFVVPQNDPATHALVGSNIGILSEGSQRSLYVPLEVAPNSLVWSPDGTHVAYITLPQISGSLCIRAIGDDRLPKDGVAWSFD